MAPRKDTMGSALITCGSKPRIAPFHLDRVARKVSGMVTLCGWGLWPGQGG